MSNAQERANQIRGFIALAVIVLIVSIPWQKWIAIDKQVLGKMIESQEEVNGKVIHSPSDVPWRAVESAGFAHGFLNGVLALPLSCKVALVATWEEHIKPGFGKAWDDLRAQLKSDSYEYRGLKYLFYVCFHVCWAAAVFLVVTLFWLVAGFLAGLFVIFPLCFKFGDAGGYYVGLILALLVDVAGMYVFVRLCGDDGAASSAGGPRPDDDDEDDDEDEDDDADDFERPVAPAPAPRPAPAAPRADKPKQPRALIDVNNVTDEDVLLRVPGVTLNNLDDLLAERRRRGGFRKAEDIVDALRLPPDFVRKINKAVAYKKYVGPGLDAPGNPEGQ